MRLIQAVFVIGLKPLSVKNEFHNDIFRLLCPGLNGACFNHQMFWRVQSTADNRHKMLLKAQSILKLQHQSRVFYSALENRNHILDLSLALYVLILHVSPNSELQDPDPTVSVWLLLSL